MKYDFDALVDRRGSGSIKWQVGENELPMWVADMDFKTAPGIREALARRVEHGVFGYTDVDDRWREAYAGWWENRHGVRICKENLIFCTGVVPAVSSIVRKLTTPNENVVLLTPVYNVFFNSIVNNGARALECPLVYENGAYSIDFDDLENKLADPQTSLMILCNPHNPVGKIWEKETLLAIAKLCEKYGVTVLSDEIHCDLTAPGRAYTPFISAGEICKKISVSLWAPTKAFNIAGIQTSAVYAENPFLFHKVRRALNTDEVAEPNVFAADAAIAAFTRCSGWLDELRVYLFENRALCEEFISKEIPRVSLVKADATYLLWIDVSSLPGTGRQIAEFIRRETGLYIIGGDVYGKGGESFLRMNIACPRQTVTEGLRRLKEGVRAYIAATQ